MSILAYITRRPRTKREIAALSGIAVRDVEQLIQQARLEGAAVISDGDGYRISTDPAEVAACADALRRRLATQYLTTRALKRTARRMTEARDLTLGLA